MTSKASNLSIRWRWGGLSVSLVVLGSTLVFIFRPISLTLLTLGGHQCYFTQPQFSLSWQHSVEKQPWQERYQRRAQDFLLLDTHFKSFGAGTPDQGQLLPAPEGYVRFEVQQPLTELNWVVSHNVQSRLILDTQALPLYQWAPDYEAATFQVQHWPWWKTVLKDQCDDYAPRLR